MSLAVVIINYRTADLTLACLASIAGEAPLVPGMRVMVVDNASGDGSAARIGAEIIARGWQPWATLMPLETNRGFAGGNNAAIEAIKADASVKYVLLLNSDTIVRPGVLLHCLQVMEREPRVGVMSCMLRNADGSIQNVTRPFPTPLRQAICSFGLPWLFPGAFGWANVYDVSDAETKTQRDCDWIGGAFMFIRRKALDAVGGMDEAFFFYGEDIEYCHRFHCAGWRVHYDPAVAIVHLGGGSSDPARLPPDERSVLTWKSRYLVQRKCYGRLASLFARATDLLAMGLRSLRLICAGKRGSEEHRRVSAVLWTLLRPLRT